MKHPVVVLLLLLSSTGIAAEVIIGRAETIECPRVFFLYGNIEISGTGAAHWSAGSTTMKRYPTQINAHHVGSNGRRLTCLYRGGSPFGDATVHRTVPRSKRCKLISNYRFRCYKRVYRPRSPVSRP